MEVDPKIIELLRDTARRCFKDGIVLGQKNAELIDPQQIDELADLYAAEFEIYVGEG